MISTILSVIAISISVIVAIMEWIKDIKISRTSLESEYFKDIYKEHLVYKIPDARKYIKFDISGKFSDTDKLIEELQELRQDSLYFQYNNPNFYRRLKEAIQKLEDYLVENTGKIFVGEEQTNVYNTLKKDMDEIYGIISDGYLGRKKHKIKYIRIEFK